MTAKKLKDNWRRGEQVTAQWWNDAATIMNRLDNLSGSGSMLVRNSGGSISVGVSETAGGVWAVLTGINRQTGRYSWGKAIFWSNGTISNDPTKGSPGDNSRPGWAYEITGCLECCIGDLVILYPDPLGSGNFYFLYEGKGRKVQAANSSQAILSNGTLINVSSYCGVAPIGGETCSIRYVYHLAGGFWVWEYVRCTPAPLTCCSHGTRSTVTVTSTLSYVSPFYWSSAVTLSGTFTLTKNQYYDPADCAHTLPLTPSPCGWAYTGPCGSFENRYYDASGNLISEQVPCNLLVVAGVAISGADQAWLVVFRAWGCGHFVDAFGVVHDDYPLEYYFGYVAAVSDTQPADPADCSTFPTATFTNGSLVVTVSP